MDRHEKIDPSTQKKTNATTRRTLLRKGLAISPALLIGSLGGITVKSMAAPANDDPSPIITQDQSVQITPGCVVTPQLTEGPYFVDEKMFRSDIRVDPIDGSISDGATLRVGLRVLQVNNAACTPLAGAMVDIWQCDALGVYSDVTDSGFSTVGKKFLRGAQVTDDTGYVEFVTIYPGWYRGRTVHTHFKVRTDPDSSSGYQFTSQLFFDDALTDIVHARAPYAAKGQRTLRNAGDGIYQQGGEQMLIQLVEDGDGYSGTYAIGVDLSAPSSPSGAGGPGGAGGPRGPRP